MTELKPCPFCGREARTLKLDNWTVDCLKLTCIAHGLRMEYETEEEAIKAWNTRIGD